MIKREELSNPNSCINRAREDEMVFVLLARDAAAPVAIQAWIEERLRLGKNAHGDLQIVDACFCKLKMLDAQRLAQGDAPQISHGVDSVFLRPECLFKYCPDPAGCTTSCAHVRVCGEKNPNDYEVYCTLPCGHDGDHIHRVVGTNDDGEWRWTNLKKEEAEPRSRHGIEAYRRGDEDWQIHERKPGCPGSIWIRAYGVTEKDAWENFERNPHCINHKTFNADCHKCIDVHAGQTHD